MEQYIDKVVVDINRYTIELSGFDLKLILESLDKERYDRLRHTPWENRNPNGYPPDFYYDKNDKKVRQVDSVISYIKKQI